ncbi:protein translocase subunit SecD [Oligosphaera ethanolica]|uniref:Multifunctional fusion protein n=1 Tax=Oligosphaera ethanolica TaxID=760260 RepID=A0AAE3VCG9_9BACT|nr:protein translocase subunit SecD [Oligosphaera ethanolica]MDQ0287930.1 SecD/SecF fusion protein [Oligosphaera ethanolica]
MKKSLIIRWIIIALVVIGWLSAMFPIRDKDYLGEFDRISAKQLAALQARSQNVLKVGNPDELKAKLDAMEAKDSDEYKALQKSYSELQASPDYEAWVKVKDFAELMRRVAAVRSDDASISGYKALERAAQGNADLYRINLSDFVNVPFQAKASNKTILRYVRVKSAGKLRLGLDLQGGTEFVLGFNEKDVPKDEKVEDIRDRILVIMDNRLNSMGVTEPEIKATGKNTISVRMPSVDEADKSDIRSTIKQAAKLEFHLVAENSDELVSQYMADRQNFRTPPGLIRKEIESERNGELITQVVFIEKTPQRIRGEDVDKAFPNVDEFGNWSISLRFKSRGARAFADVTGKNVGRQLAIVLDGVVYSAPNIREAISGGQAEISGSFTFEEARRLSGVIASGNVPVTVNIDSEFGTDPTLGADSVRSGSWAGLLGMALVILFMMWYYRVAGLIAVSALVVNTVLVLGTMALTKATITMPGIAGMVLTIGMAVDANVLIFERIREELKRGKTIGNAIVAGYQRAFSSIFDSNLTTLVTAFFMYQFGSGSVKGFAVTLSFGIFASMFTAIFMTRAIFDLLVLRDIIKGLPMRTFKFLENLNVDYLKYRKNAIRGSLVLCVVSLACFGVRYFGTKDALGLDFAGGTELAYTCDGQAPDVDEVRKFLGTQGYGDNLRVGYKRGQGGERLLEIVLPIIKVKDQVQEVDYTAFSMALDQAFPEVKIGLKQTNTVGGNVGAKFRNDAIWAAVLSTLGIIVYLAFRFELMFGLAAVLAVAHDALVSAGLFMLCGGQLSLTAMAALMTIFGYSLNDTIVIFDRIRETRELNKDKSYYELINQAVNESMSRTLLTSLTTLLVVVSLLVFGGGAIFDFALIMFFGIFTGTYSTIFIASAFINTWHKRAVRRERVNAEALKNAARDAEATAKA